MGAGDGSEAAFQRIAAKQFQAATIPEPFDQEGWPIVDEFNRAFAGQPDSGDVPAVHISGADTVGGTTSWDPAGYREACATLWGR